MAITSPDKDSNTNNNNERNGRRGFIKGVVIALGSFWGGNVFGVESVQASAQEAPKNGSLPELSGVEQVRGYLEAVLEKLTKLERLFGTDDEKRIKYFDYLAECGCVIKLDPLGEPTIPEGSNKKIYTVKGVFVKTTGVNPFYIVGDGDWKIENVLPSLLTSIKSGEFTTTRPVLMDERNLDLLLVDGKLNPIFKFNDTTAYFLALNCNIPAVVKATNTLVPSITPTPTSTPIVPTRVPDNTPTNQPNNTPTRGPDNTPTPVVIKSSPTPASTVPPQATPRPTPR